jgi:hypothetical protein
LTRLSQLPLHIRALLATSGLSRSSCR